MKTSNKTHMNYTPEIKKRERIQIDQNDDFIM